VDIIDSVLYIREGESDTVTVNVTNGIPPYTYLWNPASEVSVGSSPNSFIVKANADSVYYTVSVPYGTIGCSGIDKVLIILIPESCEQNWDSIPNVFTPNGDGKNDAFYIKNLCNYDAFFIKIFNRWGRVIYESTDPDFRWDGTTKNGDEASDGVYYYVMHAKTKDWHGYIDLIRQKRP
jgi:gliding motility-associated-like protein